MKGRIFSVIVLVLAAGVLQAVPFTCLGGIKVPTAYVLPHLMAEFSAVSYFGPGVDELTYVTVYDNDFVITDEQDLQFTYAGVFNFGLFNRVELGAVYTGNEMFMLNAKAQILYESETLPALSVGMDNLFSDITQKDQDDGEVDLEKHNFTDLDDYTANSIYVVLSKSTVLRGLPFSNYLETVLHIGFGQNRFEGNAELSKQLGGLFGAVEIKPVPYMSVIAEMDGYNVNFGANFMYKNFEFRGGIYRIEEIGRSEAGRDKVKFALNVRYTLDYFSEIKAAGKYAQFNPTAEIRPDQRRRAEVRRETGAAGENPLLEELEAIRARRRQAEEELDEIRRVLED
ncbi:MAG: hypothetical protein K8R90_04720 [Candidatus Cloacimonetes bacterium]|nr:hypothetical protein [Candidatus Cloacimonadota bacterium]